jgi:hypothetical protein
MEPKILRYETFGFLFVIFSSNVMPWTIIVGVRFMI